MTATARSLAGDLAMWAHDMRPGPADLALADRSLRDTLAVILAARDHPILDVASSLTEAGRWAAAGHVLDFDDLHMQSTTHVSVVCVPAVLASGGDARAYLAAAGVMTRLGNMLGWPHYSAGWHATCTAGAPAAAVGAGVAMNLDPRQIATAIALSVPGAGGVQRAFGTDAKALQVAFTVESGLRAARLAAAGAGADLAALESWYSLAGGDPAGHADLSGPAVPDGLAIKIYPCCYALQRPINAIAVAPAIDPGQVEHVLIRTAESSTTPLIHHHPMTGLQGKFSIEYAVATALLDDYPGFGSFTDSAVRRPEAQRLVSSVAVDIQPGGTWLLEGIFDAEIRLRSGRSVRCTQQYPPGSPQRPPAESELGKKLQDCVGSLGTDPSAWTWAGAAETLRRHLPAPPGRSRRATGPKAPDDSAHVTPGRRPDDGRP